MTRKLIVEEERVHFETEFVQKEQYTLSEPGNIALFFRYVWNDAHIDTPNKIFMKSMENMMEFVAPMLDDETLSLRKFRSPDWTWGALCGREGFVILDRDGYVVDSHVTSLS